MVAEYITNEKPPFPLAEFNKEKVVTNFRKLEKVLITLLSQRMTELSKSMMTTNIHTGEYGLGLIDAPSKFNYCADSFMNDLRIGSRVIRLQITCTKME